jgi:SSS family solute:Na+ symporter
MSTLAAKALAISSLFVRNVYRQFWPDITQRQGVFFARCTIVVVLVLGAISASLMGSFLSIINVVLTVNIPFGAAVLLTFWWRRVTAPAVWCCVVLSTLAILVVPWTAANFSALARDPALTQMSTKPGKGVYFDTVVHERAADAASPLMAKPGLFNNRFNFEAWLLGKAGVDVVALTPNQRFTAQFFFDGLFPFAILILVSLTTKPTDPARVAFFYGKMKTPVGATTELEAAGLAETRANPTRFDHTKLAPRSWWEFCRWDRVDTVGFLVCTALSGAIVLLFIGLLKWAAGSA